MTLIAPTATHDAQGNLKPLRDTNETILSRKPCGTLHYSPNYLGNLMIVARHNIRDGIASEVYLSADGGAWLDIWHRRSDGPETGGVYVERHTTNGPIFHGWIDPATRKIVQAG